MAQLDSSLPYDEMARLFSANGVLKAVLFGSFSRGTATRRSDVDLLVVQPTARRFLDRYEGLYAGICRLVKGRAVDLLIYTPEELAAMSRRKFIQSILRDGVTIYEQRTIVA